MTLQLRLAAYRAVAIDWPNLKITSSDISDELKINATQIRRDLSGLGKHGKRGVGYEPAALAEAIGLSIKASWPLVLLEAEHARLTMTKVLFSEVP